ncbi:MAG: preprotein translocase subunit SecG [Candidatus Magasanikbacteria bacterium]
MLLKVISIAQIIIAILLSISILLQQKGSGIGSAFGGSSTIFTTRRGVDKVLFNATIVLTSLFLGSALLNVIL